MIQKRMRVSMAVTLAMLFVMLAFGRARLAWFYDDVGTATAEFVAALRAEAKGVGQTITPAITARAGREATAASQPQERSTERAGESPTAAAARPEPEAPVEEPSTLPDPQAAREAAVAAVAALGPLHDELIEVLEAIYGASVDREEKRQAEQEVTMARMAKRMQLRDLELFVAAEPEWSVQGAWRSALQAKARLEHRIQEARENLARVRQSP